MKYLIVIASLGICATFLWQSFPSLDQFPATAMAQSDPLVRQTQKSEDEVLCQPADGTQMVYYIKHRWLVNEYESGKIETVEIRDTTWVEELPFGRPCPGHLIELSLR